LQVQAEMAGPLDLPRLRDRYLRRHPKAKLYADFPDFAFFRLMPRHVHLNGGFARAFDGDARLILSPLDDAAAFQALEASALDHLNGEHPEALGLYATRLAGAPEAAWRASGPFVILVTSSEALAHLWHGLGAAASALAAQTTLLVIHPRIAQAAQAQGWRSVVIAPGGDDGICDGLVAWAAQHRK
jgi:hypothetical protein